LEGKGLAGKAAPADRAGAHCDYPCWRPRRSGWAAAV